MNENNNITKQETMERQERKEQLIDEYVAAINLKVINITERVHQASAKRLDLTFDECVECLQEAIARRLQSDKEKKMAQLTKDLKTIVKYGIRLSAGVELAKAEEIWGLSYYDVQECWKNAIA